MPYPYESKPPWQQYHLLLLLINCSSYRWSQYGCGAFSSIDISGASKSLVFYTAADRLLILIVDFFFALYRSAISLVLAVRLAQCLLGGMQWYVSFQLLFWGGSLRHSKRSIFVVCHCCEYAFLVRRESGMTTTTTTTTTPTTTTTTTNNNSSSSSNETTTTEIWGSCMLLAVGCCFSWPCRG